MVTVARVQWFFLRPTVTLQFITLHSPYGTLLIHSLNFKVNWIDWKLTLARMCFPQKPFVTLSQIMTPDSNIPPRLRATKFPEMFILAQD